MSDRGNYMTTCSGGKFYPQDPRESDIKLDDIAHALSQLCRYGGHLKRFYSVAEHCIHICRAAPMEFKREALMHDASEAYLVDMPRPIKAMMPQYTVLEKGIERVIANKFRLRYPWPPEIKALDNAILLTEWNTLGCGDAEVLNIIGGNGEKPLGVTLRGWAPEVAKRLFIDEALMWVIGGLQ